MAKAGPKNNNRSIAAKKAATTRKIRSVAGRYTKKK